MFKKILPLLLISLSITNCSPENYILNIQPNIKLPQLDPNLIGITISINGTDKRFDQTIARINRNNKLIKLTPSRDLRFLLQEALEKQMIARGYMIGPNSTINLQIILNCLSAKITQGNLHYTINTKADLTILTSTKNRKKYIKNYHQSCSLKGNFLTTTKEIENTINLTLNKIISDMAEDISIHDFIKQNTSKFKFENIF